MSLKLAFNGKSEFLVVIYPDGFEINRIGLIRNRKRRARSFLTKTAIFKYKHLFSRLLTINAECLKIEIFGKLSMRLWKRNKASLDDLWKTFLIFS